MQGASATPRTSVDLSKCIGVSLLVSDRTSRTGPSHLTIHGATALSAALRARDAPARRSQHSPGFGNISTRARLFRSVNYGVPSCNAQPFAPATERARRYISFRNKRKIIIARMADTPFQNAAGLRSISGGRALLRNSLLGCRRS